MKRLNNYFDFIAESKLDLLLEANMVYSDDFTMVLNNIGGDLSDSILSLRGKDVDVNTNYIDISQTSADGSGVTFVPDNKVDPTKLPASILDDEMCFVGSVSLFNYVEEKVNRYSPNVGEKVTILRILNQEELKSNFSKKFFEDVYFVENENGKKFFMSSSGIKIKMPAVKGTETTIGRFVKKLLTKAGVEVSDKKLELFVSKFKAEVLVSKNALDRFEIVKENDIKYWYDDDNYVNSGGTLNGSCMRYKSCQSYFEIYTKNPNQVNLIILMDAEEEDKICGRAILWTDIKGNKFMDRAYTINSADEKLFEKFAIKNGFYYKEDQSNDEDMVIMFNGSESNYSCNDDVENIIIVKLDKGSKYEKYPYMDTLKYLSKEGGIITNDKNYSDNFYELEDTDGGNGCEDCGGRGRVDCDECGGRGRVDCAECDGDGRVECGDCGGDGEVDCSKCEGSGVYKGKDCPECEGSGRVECDDCNGNGRVECGDCDGDGWIECGECDGDGRVDCGTCNN